MSEKPRRRATLASVVIGLWLGGLAFLGKKELLRPHMDKLADAGLRVSPGASYFAVLQQGQQIGFASSTIDTTDGGISVHDYLVADIPVGGRTHRATARTEVNLTRKLRVTQFKMQVDAGLVPLDASGTMVGDTLLQLIVRNSATQADTHHVRLDGPVLLPTLLPLAVTLGDRPKPGGTLTLPVFDPIAMAPRNVRISVQAESVFVVPDSSVFDPARSRWMGARPDTIRAWRISTDSTGGRTGFTGWVDESGRLVLATQLLGMQLERRPYEVAFENWKADVSSRGTAVSPDRDIYETTAIAANKRLRTNTSALRLRLTGADLSGFDVKGFRQHLKGDTLTITREGPEALAALFDFIRKGNAELDRRGGDRGAVERARQAFDRIDSVLDIVPERAAADAELVQWIEARIEARREARIRRDFAESDRIRDELKARGVVLEDSAGETRWKIE